MRTRSWSLVASLLLLAACTIDEQDVVTAPLDRGPGDAVDPDESEPLRPRTTRQGPGLDDHWHVAYGFYFCDGYLPPLPGEDDQLGIHTHGDGVIHVHPFSRRATDERAIIGHFFDSAGVSVTDDSIELPGGRPDLPVRGTCDGDPARLHLVDFGSVDRPDPPVVLAGTPDELAASFVGEDRTAIAIAFVADPDEVPPPESVPNLDELSDVPANETSPELSPGVADDAVAPVAVGFAVQPVLTSSPGTVCEAPLALTDDDQCLALAGPVDGVSVERAEAQLQSVGESPELWAVSLVLTPDGIDAFNEIAAVCFDRSDPCTTGQLALVVDGEIVTAPTIETPGFERDAIQISGDFDEAEARALARAITS